MGEGLKATRQDSPFILYNVSRLKKAATKTFDDARKEEENILPPV